MLSKKQLGRKIREKREEYDYSQTALAQKLKIPRPAMSQIELGQRSLDSMELAKLANIFSISLDQLLETDEPVNNTRNTKKKSIKNKTPKINKDKFKETLLYILDKCGGKANVGETVLYKLMYFSDFDFYEKYEDYLTGANYRKVAYGPAPCEFNEIAEEMIKDSKIKKDHINYFGKTQKRYLALRKPDLKTFGAHEIDTINEVIDRLSDMNATTISDYSHNDVPWQAAKDKELINYELVFYRKPGYSRRNYNAD